MTLDSIRAGQTQPSCQVVARTLGTKPKVADSCLCILREGKASTSQESRLLTPNSELQKPTLLGREMGVQLQARRSKGQGWFSRTAQKTHSVNHWHGQKTASHPGEPETPPQKWRIPRGASSERRSVGQGPWGTHSALSHLTSPSLMANKVQNFSQDSTNICPGTELLVEHSELLSHSLSLFFFFSLFLFLIFLQRSKWGAGKEGMQVKTQWCRQMTGTGLPGGPVYTAVHK